MKRQDPKTEMDGLRAEIGQVRAKLPFETRFFDVDKVLLEARILTARHKAALEQMDKAMQHVIELVVQDQAARAIMVHELELDEESKASLEAEVRESGMRGYVALMLGLRHLAFPQGMTDEAREQETGRILNILRSKVGMLEEEAAVEPLAVKPRLLAKLSKETLAEVIWELAHGLGAHLEDGTFEDGEGKEQPCLRIVWAASRRDLAIVPLAEGDELDTSVPEDEDQDAGEEKEEA